MRQLIVVATALALALPAPAAAARFAVGVERGSSAERLAARIEAKTGRSASPIGPFALVVDAPSAKGLASVRGVSFVERVDKSRRLAFVPNDPLLPRQWYLERIRAFEAWSRIPALLPVRVAIVDSGIDADHPDLEDAIVDGRSFVNSSWRRDSNGHGTFVAGQIAASTNNNQGIAGIAFSAQLLIAKVVRADQTISLEAEAHAIRWAVDRGARVINLSFGGVRDPRNPDRDTYSPLEASAIEYAVRNGVLVVAAVGNSESANGEPGAYAGYPAALPHVLGVSAINRDGSVPSFSNSDKIFNDLAAPGEGIFSTIPRALTVNGSRATCSVPGYSDCGPGEFRRGEGTSFAAPQVTAAAALLMAEDPLLRPEQAANLLERSAVDATPARGCKRCWAGRDWYTGWGSLDVAAAVDLLTGPLPDADFREPNDEAGSHAPLLWGKRRKNLVATIDYWQDQTDIYRVWLRRGQRIRATLIGPSESEADLFLWKPGTRRVTGFPDQRRLAASATVGTQRRIRYRAPARGWYYLQVKITGPGAGRYTLRYFKQAPRRTLAGPARPGRIA
ncbi:MAG TPA: S8 family serine peptidase [Gaiellaceae bacterium]|nr:S8 family serine peptidase [Gaiellaceae bacterium]